MLNIFDMFKSIVVIILIEVQIVLSFAIASFFTLTLDPFYFFSFKKKKAQNIRFIFLLKTSHTRGVQACCGASQVSRTETLLSVALVCPHLHD